jgi:hypothetical protein
MIASPSGFATFGRISNCLVTAWISSLLTVLTLFDLQVTGNHELYVSTNVSNHWQHLVSGLTIHGYPSRQQGLIQKYRCCCTL